MFLCLLLYFNLLLVSLIHTSKEDKLGMLKQELNDVKVELLGIINELRNCKNKLKRLLDEMNHAIASENRTINKYKDCQSEHFKAKNGLNFLQYGQAFLLDIKATYDRMESENSEEYCNTLGTPFPIGDVDYILITLNRCTSVDTLIPILLCC
ncbi:hypothetical protein EWB00_003012 [Schistosoma japonicum]|uniref:Uncharacterized protein n=1 Tax=Schistosoma japonicum TaxID=6182 RepID=A0A4Z2DA28_SCHJA|nr:hypothetical protein EWB00_003012 [Schistosoma japonicum]